MKNFLATLVLSLFALSSISQQVMYDIHGNYNRRVTKEALCKANLISDFVPGYPVNWITDYLSVEISSKNGEKEKKAQGHNNVLTSNQKNLLCSAEMANGINVDVKYKYPNPATDKMEIRNANMSLTVVPYIEATFPGGDKKMKNYFKEKGIEDICEAIAIKEQQVKVFFTINENGKVTDAKLVESSKDSEMNQKILDAINDMPAWKPAENSSGIKVKQELEFKVNSMGGC